MTTTNPHYTARASRRDLLVGSAVAAVATAMPAFPAGRASAATPTSTQGKGTSAMSTITTKDGVQIFYKDWGHGQPIVFHHGWPLSSDDWDTQMLFFLRTAIALSASTAAGTGAQARCRMGTTWITTRPTRPPWWITWSFETPCISAIRLEAVRSRVTSRGTARGRVAKVVLISAVTPLMLKTPGNPDGLPDRGIRLACARAWRPTGRNSIATYRRARSMVSIVLARSRSKA